MADNKQKRLAFAICDYLQESIKNGTIKQDDAEGVEVAIQCIGEAFEIDLSDKDQQTQFSIKPANLPKIFDVFLATQKASQQKAAPSPVPAAKAVDVKAKAEELKVAGNKEMAAKKYADAIDLYSQAIELDGENAVFYSNRAAAYSQVSKFEEAVADAKRAVEVDPGYSKAYSRMGQAYFCLGKYREAKEACEEGLKLDPANTSMQQTLNAAEQKLNADTPVRSTGAAPRPGAGFDFASMMSNPNFMQMASQMMSNPAISQMMSNPAFTQMAQQVMSNPEALQNIMSDPNMARMANDMMDGGNLPGQEP
ncbi:uncharacterized protein SPPG_02087 [Spizellomyces punctatus DAOM BR117]|uniref:SGTA homodimerisation domain-containing protein n=1 Tax=Spizellomyces punctatus (strain DAOM BR117) TaxID=645134 RepID=A0A0L0HNK8_SPIPD|nr:uncharacterized protein SPPG_02087 [Spizellomyces punctatus DAOM BR117]KND03016.1 hypothetical protein SPPG_02087 [Spizellomyces punctatus DAOM BR117]|eukprot:XP_016611055.1 hypothetical protein SPPG_02087 [Spizellomyces punctatus DAOM BR117]